MIDSQPISLWRRKRRVNLAQKVQKLLDLYGEISEPATSAVDDAAEYDSELYLFVDGLQGLAKRLCMFTHCMQIAACRFQALTIGKYLLLLAERVG
jgi:hypothetical protein